MKSLADDLVATCDDIEDTQESAVISPSNTISYWLIAVVPLSIVCLLLFVVMILKYYMDYMKNVD